VRSCRSRAHPSCASPTASAASTWPEARSSSFPTATATGTTHSTATEEPWHSRPADRGSSLDTQCVTRPSAAPHEASAQDAVRFPTHDGLEGNTRWRFGAWWTVGHGDGFPLCPRFRSARGWVTCRSASSAWRRLPGPGSARHRCRAWIRRVAGPRRRRRDRRRRRREGRSGQGRVRAPGL
jgi:hypothetical protein